MYFNPCRLPVDLQLRKKKEHPPSISSPVTDIGTAITLAISAKACSFTSYLPCEALPPSMLTWTSLVSLTLNANGLAHLSEDIAQLSQLTHLNVANNRLASLPISTRYLTELRQLHLSANRLTELPTELGELTLLQHLSIDDNRLEYLPVELCKLESLQSLNALKNSLSYFPSSILALTKLQRIYLSNNQLHFIPVSGCLDNLDISSQRYVEFLQEERSPIPTLKAFVASQLIRTYTPREIANLPIHEDLRQYILIGRNQCRCGKLFHGSGFIRQVYPANLSLLRTKYFVVLVESVCAPECSVPALSSPFVGKAMQPIAQEELDQILGRVESSDPLQNLAFNPEVSEDNPFSRSKLTRVQWPTLDNTPQLTHHPAFTFTSSPSMESNDVSAPPPNPFANSPYASPPPNPFGTFGTPPPTDSNANPFFFSSPSNRM